MQTSDYFAVFHTLCKAIFAENCGPNAIADSVFVAAKCRHVITDCDLLSQFVGVLSQIVDSCRNRAQCPCACTIGCRKMSAYDHRLRFVAANVRAGKIHSGFVADKWRNPLFTHDSSILHANNAIGHLGKRFVVSDDDKCLLQFLAEVEE